MRNMFKVISLAKDYADRHELAEMGVRGLANLYPYTRIYNAEMVAYEHGAKAMLKLVEEYLHNNIDTDTVEELISAIERYVNE